MVLWPDSFTSSMQICQMANHDANLTLDHILKLLCWTEIMGLRMPFECNDCQVHENNLWWSKTGDVTRCPADWVRLSLRMGEATVQLSCKDIDQFQIWSVCQILRPARLAPTTEILLSTSFWLSLWTSAICVYNISMLRVWLGCCCAFGWLDVCIMHSWTDASWIYPVFPVMTLEVIVLTLKAGDHRKNFHKRFLKQNVSYHTPLSGPRHNCPWPFRHFLSQDPPSPKICSNPRMKWSYVPSLRDLRRELKMNRSILLHWDPFNSILRCLIGHVDMATNRKQIHIIQDTIWKYTLIQDFTIPAGKSSKHMNTFEHVSRKPTHTQTSRFVFSCVSLSRCFLHRASWRTLIHYAAACC